VSNGVAHTQGDDQGHGRGGLGGWRCSHSHAHTHAAHRNGDGVRVAPMLAGSPQCLGTEDLGSIHQLFALITPLALGHGERPEVLSEMPHTQ
jgi:hypothetical protein